MQAALGVGQLDPLALAERPDPGAGLTGCGGGWSPARCYGGTVRTRLGSATGEPVTVRAWGTPKIGRGARRRVAAEGADGRSRRWWRRPAAPRRGPATGVMAAVDRRAPAGATLAPPRRPAAERSPAPPAGRAAAAGPGRARPRPRRTGTAAAAPRPRPRRVGSAAAPRPRSAAAPRPPPPAPPLPRRRRPQATATAARPVRAPGARTRRWPHRRPSPATRRADRSALRLAEAASAAPIGLAALRPPPPAHPPADARSGSDGETLDRNYQPDISRFLQATDPQADDRTARRQHQGRAPGREEGGEAAGQGRRGPHRPTERTDQQAEAAGKDGKDKDKDGKARTQAARRAPKPGGHARSAAQPRSGCSSSCVIAALAAVLLRVFVVQPYYIPSASMEPTLHGCTGCNDDHILVDKLSYRAHDIAHRDIVVFNRPPGRPSLGERCSSSGWSACAGDTVDAAHGAGVRQRAALNEPYVNRSAGRTRPAADRHARSGRCRRATCSSWATTAATRTTAGPSGRSRLPVIGRAFMIIWPMGRVGFL